MHSPFPSLPSAGHIALMAAMAALAALSVAVSTAHAAVTWFEQPPSVAEIRRALKLPQPAARPGRAHTRGIDWSGTRTTAPGHGAPSLASARTFEGSGRSAAQSASGGQDDTPAIAMPIRFEAGSARIAPDSLRYLANLAAFLGGSPDVRVIIEGHTDAMGDPRRNLVLSWERALCVYRVMVENYQVEPAQLQPTGKGSSEPMANSAGDDTRNRRVQFRIDRDRPS